MKLSEITDSKQATYRLVYVDIEQRRMDIYMFGIDQGMAISLTLSTNTFSWQPVTMGRLRYRVSDR